MHGNFRLARKTLAANFLTLNLFGLLVSSVVSAQSTPQTTTQVGQPAAAQTSPQATTQTTTQTATAAPTVTQDGPASAQGATYYETEYTRTHFSLGLELSNLTSATGQVIGGGTKIGFEYGLSDKWSLATNVVFVLEMTGDPGSFFYSGINGAIHYAITGSSLIPTTYLKRRDGTILYTNAPTGRERITAFVGLEQLFLNGTSNIYPAVGPALGASYSRPVFGRPTDFALRYSQLQANNNAVTMMAFSIALNLTL